MATHTLVPRIRRPQPRRPSGAKVIAFLVLLVLALAWLVPFLWALATSFKSEADAGSTPPGWVGAHGFTLDAYVSVLTKGHIPLWAWNSLVTASVITVLTVAVSALAGYAFSRIRFAGRAWLYALVIASVIVPSQVLIVPLFYEMLSLGLIDSYGAVILPQAVAPAMVFILKRFFDAIPIELEDAARVDGASRMRIFWSVVLPLSRPILAAVAIFVFIGAWNNFLWPFIAIDSTDLMTLPVGLQTVKDAFGIQYAQNMAAAVLATLPLIVVFLFFQRQIIRSVTQTGFGGQ